MRTLALPWPPTVNTYWRHVVMGRSARVLLSREGRAYRDQVADAVLKQGPRPTLAGPLQVVLLAYPPDRRTRDLDNITKGILDGLTHALVYLDDSQIDDLRIVRRAVEKPGRVVVHISRLAVPVEDRIGGVA